MAQTAHAVLNPIVDHVDMETGLDNDSRKRLLNGLSQALADTQVLAMKTQNLHWNVVGPMFYSLHSLSGEMHETLMNNAKLLAGRIRALGYPVPASFEQMAGLTGLREQTKVQSANKMVQGLAEDHQMVARKLRDAIKAANDWEDYASASMLTDLIAFHEDTSWHLGALITSVDDQQT